MKVIGIICEYNPFHLGHQKQLQRIREVYGNDCCIVCLMSGNYVQRGIPAILDRSVRAKAAVLSGADLVLELPVIHALSSAEGFAAGGVRILGAFCNVLCFGAETADPAGLMSTAETLLRPDYSDRLKDALSSGCSFPAARQMALEQLGCSADLIAQPNNILAVEYCKAILDTGAPMEILPINRPGSYHAEIPDPSDPSATAVRTEMLAGRSWQQYVPEQARICFADAALHDLSAGERAILARLRTMSEAEFQSVPFGSEGLWRKLMHAIRRQATLEQILTAVKSRRYTRTRLNRMIMCAFLGITEDMLCMTPPYIRVLAFNQAGRSVLKTAREKLTILNAGERSDCDYQILEDRCGDLYSLFEIDAPGAPGTERNTRIFYDTGVPAQETPV